MAKVSIIAPNHNHEKFLGKRLQSILGQSFRDWELIFVDDASTDKSIEIFQSIANDPRVRKPLINRTKSGNIFGQWQKGIEAATGEYIWIAESDDHADKDLLKAAVQALDLNRSVGVAYTASNIIDENGNVIGVMGAKYKEIPVNGSELCRKELIFANIIPNASAALFRRSVYDELDSKSEYKGFVLSHDWILWAQMLNVSNLAYIAEPLNFFRRHGNTASNVLGRSEQAVYEKVLIMDYIVSHNEVDGRTITKAMQQLSDEWMMRILKYGRIFDRNNDIYRAAYRIYSPIGLLFIASFSGSTSEKYLRNSTWPYVILRGNSIMGSA